MYNFVQRIIYNLCIGRKLNLNRVYLNRIIVVDLLQECCPFLCSENVLILMHRNKVLILMHRNKGS